MKQRIIVHAGCWRKLQGRKSILLTNDRAVVCYFESVIVIVENNLKECDYISKRVSKSETKANGTRFRNF